MLEYCEYMASRAYLVITTFGLVQRKKLDWLCGEGHITMDVADGIATPCEKCGPLLLDFIDILI